jgi:hypothetical protein
MSGSERRKQRRAERRAKEAAHDPPKVLRLVRSEEKSDPVVEVAAGLPDPPVDSVPEPGGLPGVPEEEARGNLVDTGIAVRHDIPERHPEPEIDEPVAFERSFDIDAINAIFNDPSVLPLVSVPGIDSIDVTHIVADERNYALLGDGWVILFCWHDPGTYEVHTAFIKTRRGGYAVRASKACYRWMFIATDCVVLLTKTPAHIPQTALFCKLVGATLEFTRKAVWPTNDGPVDLGFWSLRYDDWIRQTPELMESGRKFHLELEREFERHGCPEEAHPDEDCHDLHVGACVEMIYAGQVEKAIVLYNRWARFAAYAPIELKSRHPLLIEMPNALLQVGDESFKVIKVK